MMLHSSLSIRGRRAIVDRIQAQDESYNRKDP
jgi:hypothetical protein